MFILTLTSYHMARAVFVKSARKARPEYGIAVGDSYYWWKFRFGGTHYSKTPPKRSQLTQSPFLSQLYELQDRISDIKAEDRDDLKSQIEEICSEIENLRDECQESLDNMPDQLQESDTGQMLQERVEALDGWKDELENIDTEDEDRELTELIEEVQGTDCGL